MGTMPRMTDDRDPRRVPDSSVEYVNGVIIGGEEYGRRYRFYTREGERITPGEQWFSDDAEAVAWFRARYPEHYRQGAEMRCYYD